MSTAILQSADTPTISPPLVDVSSPASVVYPLSAAVKSMLSGKEPRWSESSYLPRALSGILHSATVLFKSQSDHNHFVARCNGQIVVKAISTSDPTEYEALKFLETVSPTFLAPAPHGVIAIGKVWYMFMSCVPGVSLESIWHNLSVSQKKSVSNDLDKVLVELHRIPFQHGDALGGLAAQGCKDTRRHTRKAPGPIYSCEGVWEFMYGSARNKETAYGEFLRRQTFPPREQKIAFIHGDFRPANIMVQHHQDAHVKITGLIDWEMSGFYPKDLECVKALNNLSPIGKDDWYLFLPQCLSPRDHLESWHADVMWDPYIA